MCWFIWADCLSSASCSPFSATGQASQYLLVPHETLRPLSFLHHHHHHHSHRCISIFNHSLLTHFHLPLLEYWDLRLLFSLPCWDFSVSRSFTLIQFGLDENFLNESWKFLNSVLLRFWVSSHHCFDLFPQFCFHLWNFYHSWLWSTLSRIMTSEMQYY